VGPGRRFECHRPGIGRFGWVTSGCRFPVLDFKNQVGPG
jgi:hypothetical protein